jgi:hypothetical protein
MFMSCWSDVVIITINFQIGSADLPFSTETSRRYRVLIQNKFPLSLRLHKCGLRSISRFQSTGLLSIRMGVLSLRSWLGWVEQAGDRCFGVGWDYFWLKGGLHVARSCLVGVVPTGTSFPLALYNLRTVLRF